MRKVAVALGVQWSWKYRYVCLGQGKYDRGQNVVLVASLGNLFYVTMPTSTLSIE